MSHYGRKVERLLGATENPGDLPLLGAVCWFDLQSGASRAALEQAMLTVQNDDARGIIEDNLPPEPKADQSFGYAISNAATGLKGIQTTKLEQSSAKVVASILQRQEQDNGQGVERVDFVQRTRVALLLRDRQGVQLQTPMIVHETNVAGDPSKGSDPVGLRLENLYRWHRDHLTPDDVRPMVTRTFESADRLILRRAGGMYFVPAPNLDIIRELFNLLDAIGCSGYFLPIFETTEALETLGACATDDALDDVAALMDELDRFDAALDDGKAMRGATLEARIDKLDDLRSKTTLYARILRHDCNTIEQRFTEAQAKLEELVTKREYAQGK